MDEEKVFNVQKSPGESDDMNTHPGKSFRDMWDTDSIGEAVTIAHKNQTIPRFRLDKVEIHLRLLQPELQLLLRAASGPETEREDEPSPGSDRKHT